MPHCDWHGTGGKEFSPAERFVMKWSADSADNRGCTCSFVRAFCLNRMVVAVAGKRKTFMKPTVAIIAVVIATLSFFTVVGCEQNETTETWGQGLMHWSSTQPATATA